MFFLRELLIERYKGRTITTSEILCDFSRFCSDVNKNTLIWNINEMIKTGDVVRIGRGKYYFSDKPSCAFTTPIAEDVQKVVDIISNQFKYVKMVVTDSIWLSNYLVQQPFATVVKIEVNEPAVNAVVSLLRKEGIVAFSIEEVADADKYFSETRVFVIDKIRFHNPTKKYKSNVSIAKVEKIMVDLVCDYEAYKQYQGWELENIYLNITEVCAINFSTITRYASSRGRKGEVLSLLAGNEKYQMFLRSSIND